jgi:hypothetical protein
MILNILANYFFIIITSWMINYECHDDNTYKNKNSVPIFIETEFLHLTQKFN